MQSPMRVRYAAALSLTAFSCWIAGPSLAATDQPQQEKEFGALEYRLLGPPVGGRISAVAGVPGDSQVYYASAAQGGLWKSANGGRDWEPLFDEQSTQSIGSFAIADSDPNVIYVCSGEANIRGNVDIGWGIWKSIDAGQTWRQRASASS